MQYHDKIKIQKLALEHDKLLRLGSADIKEKIRQELFSICYSKSHFETDEFNKVYWEEIGSLHAIRLAEILRR